MCQHLHFILYDTIPIDFISEKVPLLDHIVHICCVLTNVCNPIVPSDYVRPIIEYASVVWSPYTKDDISRLEMVQRKAAHFVYNDFYSYSSVTAMLNKLNWRREDLKPFIQCSIKS